MPQPVLELFGWDEQPAEVDKVVSGLPHPVFALAAHDLLGSGDGEFCLLWKCLEQVRGSFPIRRQTIGDCVSQGYATCSDVLQAVEIVLKGERQRWNNITATEPNYGHARKTIGRGRLSGDGCVGAWMAKSYEQAGVVARGVYGDIDLRRYSGKRAREYGKRGCPASLRPHMRKQLVRTISLVRTYEEAEAAIWNGYPVAVASRVGFSKRRDRDGFSRRSGSWAHLMCYIGARRGRNPGLLQMNSWGPNWNSGPLVNQPEGSFWTHPEDVERQLRMNDTFACSQHDGYPAQSFKHNLI